MDEVRIQYRFTVEAEGYPDFTDAIYFTIEEFNEMSDADLEALKAERWENWATIFDNPPVEVDAPPAEE